MSNLESLTSGVVDIKPGGNEALKKLLEKAKEEGRQLRVKLGIDPTSSDLHLGHMVCIQKLKQFQDAGHLPVLLIGGYTAQVGDPSGRNEARPPLTKEEVQMHAQTYLDQVSRVLDLDKAEVVNNADWFEKFTMTDMVKLAGKFTINQMIAKEAFGKRLDEGNPLYMHEIMYPVLQGYDSYEIKADIELGGTDQTFNLMVGRDIQRAHEQAAQLCMTMPLLVGLDGSKKMSKSSKNYIALNDSANDMFGKVMSIPDELIVDYFTLAARATQEEIADVKSKLESGENPRNVKVLLGKKIVEIYYDAAAAEEAEQAFVNQFKKKEIPDDIPELALDTEAEISSLVLDAKLCASKGEFKRLVAGGGVKLDGEKVADHTIKISLGDVDSKVLQIGKRKFLKLVKK